MIRNEDEITEIIVTHLQEKGFEIEKKTLGRKRGVDIKASKNGKSCFFENEGNKRPNQQPLRTHQKYTHLLRCVGQICLRMQDDGEYYIGLPEDKYYREHIQKLRKALTKLTVKIVWVQENGMVKEEEP
jgi:hypothetical protein